MTEWQPISTAPKDMRVLLFYDLQTKVLPSTFGMTVGQWDSWRDPPQFASEGFNDEAPQPTHWMLLPDPPNHKQHSA